MSDRGTGVFLFASLYSLTLREGTRGHARAVQIISHACMRLSTFSDARACSNPPPRSHRNPTSVTQVLTCDRPIKRLMRCLVLRGGGVSVKHAWAGMRVGHVAAVQIHVSCMTAVEHRS
jgi:hypothetical protein